MASRPIAWSHSRIKMFRECPKQFHHMNVLKDVEYVQSDAARQGDVVHKMIQSRLESGTPFVPGYEKYENVALAFLSAPGTTIAEQRLTLNKDLVPTGYFDKDAYIRVIIDAVKLNAPQAYLADWKTGRVEFKDEQLKLNSAVFFHHYPDVDEIRASYVFLNAKVVDGKTYHRSDLLSMWNDLLEEPKRLQAAADANHWPARPGRHCRWCNVNRARKCDSAQEAFKS